MVFRAWTTREATEEWYRDGDDHVVNVVELDLRVGGHRRVEFGPRGQTPYVETGTYVDVDPPHKLVLVGGLDGVTTPWHDTRVTVVFEEEDGNTRLTLVHEGFPSSIERDNAAHGWPGFIDRLERIVSSRGGAE
ncbi:MAG: SRPBCC family protein [Actinomycetota bacterium]